MHLFRVAISALLSLASPVSTALCTVITFFAACQCGMK